MNTDSTTSSPLMFSAEAANSNNTLTLLGALTVLGVTACYFTPAKFVRWIEKKRYQYEVTFSLYMMTPTEKFIFSEFSYTHALTQQYSFRVNNSLAAIRFPFASANPASLQTQSSFSWSR